MKFSIGHEDITPELAKKYLALSKGNRRLRESYVLSLAVDMEQEKWDPDASEIVFDEDVVLIDGHHRLHAVVLSGKTVRMLVKRGVAKTARSIIDTGGSRSVTDLLRMFRAGTSHPQMRRAYLIVCTKLHSEGAFPVIRTLETYDSWMRQFREGVDWIVETLMTTGLVGSVRDKFRVAPIAAAFAFAHKTAPTKVEKFFLRAVTGEGLQKTDPALTLNRFVLAGRHEHQGGGRPPTSLKVLNAILADLEESTYLKLQAGEAGLTHFRKAYKTASMARLADPWEETEPT